MQNFIRQGSCVYPLAAALGLAFTLAGPVVAAVTEADYLIDLPDVSSVTRLPQSQLDAPGAVTVLTREMIRQSGARDVVDLLRWVPGMYITGYNGAHRAAAYQASLDEYSSRMQVFIDGRSVYSTYYIGGASTALTTLPLEEIERIEVQRGANSAAFGTNALFGVVNIITRHARDSARFSAKLALGGNAVEDSYVSTAMTRGALSVRLSAGTINDDGFARANDFRHIDHARLRADMELGGSGQLQLSAGAQRLRSINGFKDKGDNPERNIGEKTAFVAASWSQPLSPATDLQLSADYTREDFADRALLDLGFATVDANLNGESTRQNLEAQLTHRSSPQLRWVVGLGARKEEIHAPFYFDGKDVGFDRLQTFGNAEWQPAPGWVINAGGLFEHHSAAGEQWAPRLALNYHLTPMQSIRVISSRAFHMPSLLESYANTWVRDLATGTKLLREYYQAEVPEPERMKTLELGYLGYWPALQASLDVRLFRNELNQLMNAVPNTAKAPNDSSTTTINAGDLEITGLEYQLRWRPLDGTDIRLGQTRQNAETTPGRYFTNNVADRIDTLGATHEFASGVRVGALYSRLGKVSSRSFNKRTPIDPTDQLDVQLAYRFVVAGTHAELAFNWVAAGGEVIVYNQSKRFALPTHVVTTLRLEL